MLDSSNSSFARTNDDSIANFSRFLRRPFYFDTLEVRQSVFAIGGVDNEFRGSITGGEDSRRVLEESYRFLTIIGDTQVDLEVV
jgi:hypothetical protein